MRSLLKIGLAAGFAATLLCGDFSLVLAQQADEATELNKKVVELYNAGRYSDAIPIAQRVLALRERALGRDHPDVAVGLSNLANLYYSQRRYADAEPLYQRSLAINEKALGRDHPNVAVGLSSLATLYYSQGRYTDALPIIRRTLSQGTAWKTVAFPVLLSSQAQNLINAAQALAGSYEIVQRASSTAAANAVSKLAARFAVGSGELAQLVRKDQDLTAEADALDGGAFVSKPPSQRSAVAEDQVRKRIEAVKAEREKLQQIFNDRFPEYLALSKPQPVSLAETRALLADDEALLVFDFDAKSYGWIITKNNADWTELKVSAKDLDVQVRALRVWLTDPRKRFDPELSFKIYQATFGAFDDKFAAKQRLSIVTNGALTSLPPQLLVATTRAARSSRSWTGSSARMRLRSCLPSRASKSCAAARKLRQHASR